MTDSGESDAAAAALAVVVVVAAAEHTDTQAEHWSSRREGDPSLSCFESFKLYCPARRPTPD